MSLDFSTLGLTGWVMLTFAFFGGLTVLALAWVGLGLLIEKAPLGVRAILWPTGWLVLLVVLASFGIPLNWSSLLVGTAVPLFGLLWGLLLFGFMRPEFSGQLKPYA